MLHQTLMYMCVLKLKFASGKRTSLKKRVRVVLIGLIESKKGGG